MNDKKMLVQMNIDYFWLGGKTQFDNMNIASGCYISVWRGRKDLFFAFNETEADLKTSTLFLGTSHAQLVYEKTTEQYQNILCAASVYHTP